MDNNVSNVWKSVVEGVGGGCSVVGSFVVVLVTVVAKVMVVVVVVELVIVELCVEGVKLVLALCWP